jgi:hypothetical protein
VGRRRRSRFVTLEGNELTMIEQKEELSTLRQQGGNELMLSHEDWEMR